ncbi:response regulator transcription factor [Marinomonas rhizomae]|uniref:response regulator transcription factor n=1 Tax=Marinomonas rhizomae TaxID=491948 RepID=UPI00210596F3|nr:response regulator transcription factor [Marinomonas rhizomae]UTV99988.1 response regulator transcription factor [Marinomonas rhizomae]
MTCIYFVEDNTVLLNNGLLWLKSEGYDAHGASSAKELSGLMENQIPDLVILDWNLPGEDGLSIAGKLRNDPETQDIFIIFVTARNSMDDRLSALGEADAYITKPFDYRELLATIRALLRRSNNNDTEQDLNTWKYLPAKSIILSPDEIELEITEKESILIQLFIQHPKKVVSPKMISEAFNEDLSIFEKNRIEVLVSRLRNKLKTGNDNPIRSFRNKGYQLMINIKKVEE